MVTVNLTGNMVMMPSVYHDSESENDPKCMIVQVVQKMTTKVNMIVFIIIMIGKMRVKEINCLNSQIK